MSKIDNSHLPCSDQEALGLWTWFDNHINNSWHLADTKKLQMIQAIWTAETNERKRLQQEKNK